MVLACTPRTWPNYCWIAEQISYIYFVKHLSHFLFTAAILLASLMIYNGQKNEDPTKVRENPDIAHTELQAEICFTRIASASVGIYQRNSAERIIPTSGSFNNPDYLIRLKIQMKTHRELLPELGYQSGHFLQHHSPFEDPLIA